MSMIRRATGKIDSFTKESGEVVDNFKKADCNAIEEVETEIMLASDPEPEVETEAQKTQ